MYSPPSEVEFVPGVALLDVSLAPSPAPLPPPARDVVLRFLRGHIGQGAPRPLHELLGGFVNHARDGDMAKALKQKGFDTNAKKCDYFKAT